MTSAQLIAAIQKADPTGNMKVVLQDSNHSILGPFHEPEVEICTKYYLNKAKDSAELTESDIGKEIMFI